MPYACDAGDAEPVVITLQQLDGDFETASFCAAHWAQFVAAAYAAMFPGTVAADPEDGPQTAADGPDTDPEADGAPGPAEDVHGDAGPADVPADAPDEGADAPPAGREPVAT